MKKLLLLIIPIVILTGCNSNDHEKIINDLDKKINNSKSYYLEGDMKIINNEDEYTYFVSATYKKGDYYKINLVNTLNNHEQVILRNDDGVYVVTPSLNKSFKFQSDWPYNNSQVYLLSSIIDDLMDDKDRTYSEKDNMYVFKSHVNYPNDKKLVYQYVYISKKGNIEKCEVVDNEDNVGISMEFKKIEFNKKLDDDYFDLNKLIKINYKEKDIKQDDVKEKKNDSLEDSDDVKDETAKKEEKSNETFNSNEENRVCMNDDCGKTEQTASINDIIYPMYLPNNTYLEKQDKLSTSDGERLILTFGGDNSFVLIEEVEKISDEVRVIPVSGNFEIISDVIGIVSDKSLSWNSNGINYYLTSDVLEVSELINIANSVSVLPVSK